MFKVCIDPGHGGHDSGANYNGLKEKDVVLKVALNTVDALDFLDPGINWVLTRDVDIYIPLQNRCDIANNFKADCFVSIHCNADPDPDLPGMPEAKGEEIWYYKGSAKGFRLAKSLEKWVDSIFPTEPFRGIKETENFYVLKHTKMPAVLIEIGFIDKSDSEETFSDEFSLRKIGFSIARGIFEYAEKL